MTENVKWEEEHILASDLWSIEKSLTPMSPQEEFEAWRKTVGILRSLCTLGDTLVLDPLILALADALSRAREELARVEDRLSRPPIQSQNAEKLAPREHRRLVRMLRRCDALQSAHTAMLDWNDQNNIPSNRDIELAIIKGLRTEAGEQFTRYKQEAGFPTTDTPE